MNDKNANEHSRIIPNVQFECFHRTEQICRSDVYPRLLDMTVDVPPAERRVSHVTISESISMETTKLASEAFSHR
jgi:hypothetical protein